MKTITLQEAYNLLFECAAVVTDDYALMYPSLQGIEEEGEFLILSWEDEGEEYRYDFYPRNNQTVNIEDSSMYLYDEIGASIKLTLLAGMPLVKEDKPVTNFEQVEAIRDNISNIRHEINMLIWKDKLWESWLSPSVGACTCILESLFNAMLEMEKHHKKWVAPQS